MTPLPSFSSQNCFNKFILSISLIFLFTGCDDYVDYEASEIIKLLLMIILKRQVIMNLH